MCEKMSVYAGEKRDQVNILRLCCGCGVCGVFACCGCGVCGVFAAVLPRQYLQYLLIGYQQFLQAGVKVKTLEFLQEILLSMEVALSMFFLFLPISSFGRHRTIVPLRGTLMPIVQRTH